MNTNKISSSAYCIRPIILEGDDDMYVSIIQTMRSLGYKAFSDVPKRLRTILAGEDGRGTLLVDAFALGARDDAVMMDVVSMACLLTVDYMRPETLALWRWFESTYVEHADVLHAMAAPDRLH